MKLVTPQYKNSMNSTVRDQGFAMITFGNVDITARTDGTWSGSGTAWSSFNHINYDYNYGNTVATLELNKWCLDGSSVILPVDNSIADGFISSALESTTIQKTFTNPHDMPGITLVFDSRTKEWANNVTLSYLDENGDVIDSDTFTPNAVTFPMEFGGTSVYGIRIAMSTTLTGHRLRVETVRYGIGKVFSNDDIISIKESTDIDPLSRRLPNESLDFTIYDPNHEYDPSNLEGIYAFINKGSPIQVQYGYTLPDETVEWLTPDTYSLSDIPEFKSSKVSFKAVGLIQTMTGKYYKGVVAHSDFYTLAEAVLTDANLPPTEQGTNPWDIDESLQTMYTDMAIPICTHAEALQTIAHATGCRLYTDDNNIIHLKPFGVSVVGIFSGSFSDNGHESYSTWQYADTGSPYTQTVATLELNRWVLENGSQQIIQTNPAMESCFVSEFERGITAFTLDESVLNGIDLLG